jgi:hypothetical protein
VDQDLTFDRFTEPARLALFHARGAVSEHGGTALIDAHLLLGLLKAAPKLGPPLRPNVNIQRLSECLVGAVAAPLLPPTNDGFRSGRPRFRKTAGKARRPELRLRLA